MRLVCYGLTWVTSHWSIVKPRSISFSPNCQKWLDTGELTSSTTIHCLLPSWLKLWDPYLSTGKNNPLCNIINVRHVAVRTMYMIVCMMCMTHTCTNKWSRWNKLFCSLINKFCKRACQFRAEQSIVHLFIKICRLWALSNPFCILTDGSAATATYSLLVSPASHVRCERCRKHTATNPNQPCDRCLEVMSEGWGEWVAWFGQHRHKCNL